MTKPALYCRCAFIKVSLFVYQLILDMYYYIILNNNRYILFSKSLMLTQATFT